MSGNQELMYAAAGGMIVSITPLRNLVPALPPVVHTALGGMFAQSVMDVIQGKDFQMPQCLSMKKAAVGAAGGMLADMYL